MNFAAFADAPLIIQIHALCAIGSFIVGGVQFFGPKGRMPHRVLGWVFVSLMVVTATSAIFIRQINSGSFSFIHLFVPLTFFGLFGLVMEARRHKVTAHRNSVLGLYFGALLIPGLFAFAPGRLMWEIVAG